MPGNQGAQGRRHPRVRARLQARHGSRASPRVPATILCMADVGRCDGGCGALRWQLRGACMARHPALPSDHQTGSSSQQARKRPPDGREPPRRGRAGLTWTPSACQPTTRSTSAIRCMPLRTRGCGGRRPRDRSPASTATPARAWQIRPMISTLRGMPAGVWLFLVYAFIILAVLGLSLPAVVNLATGDAPISGVGSSRRCCWRTPSSPSPWCCSESRPHGPSARGWRR